MIVSTKNKKSLDFEDATNEFPEDRMSTLINVGKIIIKLNRNAESYYVNSELVDLETTNLLILHSLFKRSH